MIMVLFLIIQDAECYLIHKINQNLTVCRGIDNAQRMWKIIHEKNLKSITFAHFKTEWTARRRKAGWESNLPSVLPAPGQSPVI